MMPCTETSYRLRHVLVFVSVGGFGLYLWALGWNAEEPWRWVKGVTSFVGGGYFLVYALTCLQEYTIDGQNLVVRRRGRPLVAALNKDMVQLVRLMGGSLHLVIVWDATTIGTHSAIAFVRACCAGRAVIVPNRKLHGGVYLSDLISERTAPSNESGQPFQ